MELIFADISRAQRQVGGEEDRQESKRDSEEPKEPELILLRSIEKKEQSELTYYIDCVRFASTL